MPTISTLTVDVETNTSKFTKGLKIAGAGLAALGAGAVLAFKAFEDSEKVAAQTDAVLKSTGHSANVTADDIDKLTHGLMMKAAIDDEVIRTGANMLLTFKNIRNEVGRGNDIFDQATKATLDMSVAMGVDMKSSAIQVGKALNDPIAGISALSRVGVTFSEQTKKQIEQLVKQGDVMGAQKIILAELTSEFQGSAKAQATSSAAASVAFGELAEKIGSVIAPAFKFLVDQLLIVADFIESNVGPAFRAVRDWALEIWERVQPLAEGIANVLVPAFRMAWGTITHDLLPGLKKLWDAFQPILKVVGAAALLFGVVIVGQVAIFITIIGKLIGWLGDLVEGFMKVVSWVREHFAAPIVGAIEHVITWIGRVITWVRDRLVAAWDAIKAPIQAVINFIKGLLEDLIQKIGDVIEGLRGIAERVADAFGGNIGIPPTFPGAASGGHVKATGLAVIHKGEEIIPAGSAFGAGNVTVNVSGWVGSPDTLARKIRDELNRLGARNGTTGLIRP